MKGTDISYMHTPFASEDFSNILPCSSKFLPPSFTSSAQNAFMWYICGMCNVKRQDLNLEASNDASKDALSSSVRVRVL